ncbi:MAG TPA: DUF3048 domain-containing protein [Anaerolineaceae bacterium]|mgnify:CR=1 FL=1|nr:DUF3048 domain-containing protein [Anaerolineaceae bacterium]
MKASHLITMLFLFSLLLQSCSFSTPSIPLASTGALEKSAGDSTAPASPSSSPVPTLLSTPQTLGPLSFPHNVNPLNGLPVKHPENLKNPPFLVSISNFPPTARPQAGLSYCPIVFEIWIGEGMTRFLGVFYGDFPERVADAYPEDETTTTVEEPLVGPIRSGRLPYESIRSLFSGYLVMASASPNVSQQISAYTNFFGNDLSDPNSAMMRVTQLEALARSNPKELGRRH